MKSNTFKNYLIGKGLANSSVDSVYKDLMMFMTWAEDESIECEQTTYVELLSYIKYLQKRGLKQRTVQCYMGSLKHYFTWLIKREIRTENPAQNLDVKGVKRQYLYDIIKKQELEQLYESFKITEVDEKNKNQNWFKASQLVSKRNRVILGLMIYQGLGAQELSRLEEKDLKLREGKIYIKGNRKSNERELKLESVQILDLMEYTLQIRQDLLALTGKATELLFVSNGVSHEFRSIMQKMMKKLKEQNPRITSVQQIRTSVITHWLKNYNLREVQYMAGHRYVSSTESYLINDLEGLQEDVAKFHPIG